MSTRKWSIFGSFWIIKFLVFNGPNYKFSFALQLQAMLTFSYVSKCVHPGPKCSDCENLIFCVSTPTGFRQFHLNYCNMSEGQYCSSRAGGCTNDTKVCKIFGLTEMECQVIVSYYFTRYLILFVSSYGEGENESNHERTLSDWKKNFNPPIFVKI